jgi:hypothetical protein
MNGRVRRRIWTEGSMTKVQLALMTVGTCALVLAVTDNADAAPPAKGANAPMSIQPTAKPADAKPADTAAPQAAQPKTEPKFAQNSLFAELAGAGGIYSINYERMVADEVAVRAGFSYLSMSASVSAGGDTASSSTTLMTFPITASYLGVHSGKHALELGGGTTLISSSGTASGTGVSASGSGFGALGTAMVGYAIHPIDGAGFNFRIGALMLMGKGVSLSAAHDPTAFGVAPWGYLSLGASF